MAVKELGVLTAALYEAALFELRRRLADVARTEPSVAREVSYVDTMLGHGCVDDLPADWCRRLKLAVHAANRRKVIVVKEEIQGPQGEQLVEIDRVVFDEQLRVGAPGGDVWLDVALVHPAELASHYRCRISTRFSLADMKVSATVAELQHRWSERFGAHFFKRDEVHRYVYSPLSGKVTRAYGALSRYRIASGVARVYQYLNVIAHAWEWCGPDPQASPRTVRQSILDNAPSLALNLFADTSKDERRGSGDERPKLKVELVERVGQALGYVSALGMRRVKGWARPAHGEIDKRLLPLVAKILAQKHRKSAATLLRTVVRPALLDDAFMGFVFESAERIVRPKQSTYRAAKRDRTPAQERRGEPSCKKD